MSPLLTKAEKEREKPQKNRDVAIRGVAGLAVNTQWQLCLDVNYKLHSYAILFYTPKDICI